MTLGEAIDETIRERMRRAAPATVAFRMAHRGYLVAHFGDRPVGDFLGPPGYDLVRAYVRDEQARGLSNHSLVKRLVTLRMALAESVRRGTLAALPPWPDLPSDYRPRETWLTRPEWSRLRAELMPHRQLWLDLGVFTGMHAADIADMTWDHVRGFGAGAQFLRRNTKNRARPVWYKCAPSLAKALGSAARGNGPIVGPWDRASRDLSAAAARVGIDKHLTPNDLRRSAASWLIEDGTDLLTVKAFLGHSSISKMLERVYARVSDERVNAAVGGLG